MSLQNVLNGKSKTGCGPLGPKRGWIGIDIGSRANKMAQVEKTGNGFRISARWTLNSENSSIASRDEIGNDFLLKSLSGFKTLKRLFSGRDCASVLSMSMVDFRLLEIPTGNADEQRQMVGEELAADLGMEPNDLAFDSWEVGTENGAKADLKKIASIAVPKKLAEQLNNSLLSAGLECHALDGMPTALARAVAMAGLDRSDRAVIAVDLAYTSPLFVLVKGGQPVLARTLRGVGLQTIMQPLETNLQISSEECQQLLSCYGVAIKGQSSVAATQKTMEWLTDPLYNLVTEIKRTIDYVGTQFRTLKPDRICLFGGGALVNNLPEYLSQQLNIPASPWTLGGEHVDPTDALYGVAAGLSLLKWEASLCS
jgi:Tfp pilus assembly PilM family ATPase